MAARVPRIQLCSEAAMYFWIFLFLFLLVLLIAIVPVWPYSRRWGYTPTVGYIGPWTQAGPPFLIEEGAPGVEEDAVETAPNATE